MFGIGFGELMVIAAVVLIAVGPRRLPVLMKSLGRAMREFRKATRELRSQVGLDELLADEDLRNPLPDLRRVLDADPPRTGSPGAGTPSTAREYPKTGVDVAEAEREPGGSD